MSVVERELARLWSPDDGAVAGRVRLAREGGRLVLAWQLQLAGAPSSPGGASRFHDGLWEYDVIELFVRGSRDGELGPRYLEMEVAASGHWLVLRFDGVRERAGTEGDLVPMCHHEVGHRTWKGTVSIAEADVLRIAGPRPWRVLACAVLDLPREAGSPRRRAYLGWPALPGTSPDFHQPSAWASWVDD